MVRQNCHSTRAFALSGNTISANLIAGLNRLCIFDLRAEFTGRHQ